MWVDGFFKFGLNNCWGYFLFGLFVWWVSKENFFKNSNMIYDFKFCIGYGEVGN